MIQIRPEQLAVWRNLDMARFEQECVDLVRDTWSKEFEELGEERVRSRAGQAIDLAAGYGITTEQGVLRYLNLMFALGSGFDGSEDLPWCARILKSDLDAEERLSSLEERAAEHLRATDS